MSATNAPYGLKPVALIGSKAYAGAMREISMTTNSAVAICTGMAIAINAGQPVCIAATPTTTRSTSTPVGVCIGVTYIDPTLKQFHTAQHLPANAITNGYTKVKILVVDDPDTVFMIQADGAVANTALGLNTTLVEVADLNTDYGKSKMRASASAAAATATLAVRIVGFSTQPSDAIGDAFTNVLVKFNQGVHAYTNSTGG